MFSPSLLAMLLHSIGSDLPNPTAGRINVHPTPGSIANDLELMVRAFSESRKPMPNVPVIGHTRSLDGIRSFVEYSERPSLTAPGTLRVWGRIPVDVLVARLLANHALEAKYEYLDLGTPLTEAQQAGASVASCQAVFQRQQQQQPSLLRVAVIDAGERVLGHAPDNLGGRVAHLNTQDVVFTDHAVKVLETLLERLDHHSLVPHVDFIVGLVAPPANSIGRGCFMHANTVELQSTLQALATHVGSGGSPLVTNLSMGTHIGPHTGDSPLEQSIATLLPFGQGRVLVCAAGNEGMAGVAAQRTLEPNVSEHLRLRTNSHGCAELLVELWWDDPQSSSLTVNVEVKDQMGRVRGVPIAISPGTSGVTTMQRVGTQFNSVACQSLYQAQCLGTQNCIAFAMSAQQSSDLADLTIDLELLGTRTTLDVRGWVVIADRQACSFVGGSVDASICVPATLPDAIAVAGITAQGQPWRDSSRGSPLSPGAPALGHLVQYVAGPDEGTSFSAPRATADAVERMCNHARSVANPYAVHVFLQPADLAQAVVAKHGHASSQWNPRTGYGHVSGGP
jgi:hypothetical protein